MIIKRKLFSKGGGNEPKEKKNHSIARVAAGIGSIGLGGAVLENVNRHGEVSGRKRLYHVTDEKNVKSILENGLKGSKALDPDNPTNSMMNNRAIKDGRKLVYTAENKKPIIGMKGWYKRKGKKAKELKISIDYDDYKNLKQTDQNPEFFNARTVEDYEKKRIENHFGKFDEKEGVFIDSKGRKTTTINGMSSRDYLNKKVKKVSNSMSAKEYFNTFKGGKGSPTKIIEGDIDSKFIKGGKGYEKNSLRKVMKYAKNNPKRFLKGAGKATIGMGAIAGGTKLISSSLKKKKTI